MFRAIRSVVLLASVLTLAGGSTPLAQGGRPAAALSVLSTNAITGPLTELAEEYQRQTGTKVAIEFETSPAIARRLAAEQVTGKDVLVLSAAVAEQAVKDGRALADGRVALGRMGVGVAVKRGAARPDISTVDALKASLNRAEGVLYTQGASGVYVEKMLQSLGMADVLKTKGVQLTTGDAMLERLAARRGNDIGFTQLSEVMRAEEHLGVTLVGPLPAAVQNYTAFDAVVMAASQAPEAARAFVHSLATPAARKLLSASGWQF